MAVITHTLEGAPRVLAAVVTRLRVTALVHVHARGTITPQGEARSAGAARHPVLRQTLALTPAVAL